MCKNIRHSKGFGDFRSLGWPTRPNWPASAGSPSSLFRGSARTTLRRRWTNPPVSFPKIPHFSKTPPTRPQLSPRPSSFHSQDSDPAFPSFINFPQFLFKTFPASILPPHSHHTATIQLFASLRALEFFIQTFQKAETPWSFFSGHPGPSEKCLVFLVATFQLRRVFI